MAQWDACPTGDQVAGLIPAGAQQHSFVEMVILFHLLIQEGQLSVSDVRMSTNTGSPLRGLSLPRKSVVK